MINKIERVMAANRGEIAVRIFRACNELGMRTLAIHSKEDSLSLFRSKADESYMVGENLSPLAAYLDIDRIVSLAKKKQVDAIHPGYGFLSENPDFARACQRAGIIFIGPPAAVLEKVGDKINAKKVAADCGVPTIPGSRSPLASIEEALALAETCGYPVILKASAGGGGRGMRLAANPEELRAGYGLVRNEARKAFGSDAIFIEKYLPNPKHIEVQILADAYGGVVHLHERDCSVQRRYQKVVEYAPAFTVDPAVRAKLYRDAVAIAKAVGYVNAGTVEFLVDDRGNYFFIEMNPRIQVEHTVTEMVTGVDIVQAQVLIAKGYALDSPEIGIPGQAAIETRGFAIQCRITTEDPRNNFLPDTGKITTYRSGGGFGVRLDAGNAFAGAVITPYYDSLLVKITTTDRSFQGTINKALRSIGEIRIRGVKTNIAFISNILRHPVFQAGDCHTKFIDETPALFEIEQPQDRATKVLRRLGEKILSQKLTEKPAFDKPRIPAVPEATSGGGPKELLDSQGPAAVSRWALAQSKLLICDTTLRDAHQSLLATRVRTRDMLNIARATSYILRDAFSLEMWGGATFDVSYRFLRESPWNRLDELRRRIPNILFQMLFRGANAVGYTNYPDNVIRTFIREAAAGGIDIFRIFDSLNWLPGMELAIEEVLRAGKIAEGAICYTGDITDPKRDKYPLRYYVDLAKELARRGIHFLCIKDMAGLLRPYGAKMLVRALKEAVDIPVRLHTHDTSGNQIAAYLLAAEAGVDVVDCAIGSMASLTSQPSFNSLAAALAGGPRATGFDPLELQKLSDYWEDVRPMYRQFESDLKAPNADIYRYEIPGGQYSNLKPQVESLGLGHRFDEVKEKYREANEILGDIVKVTPSSKMVGDLAIFMTQNNLTGENIVSEGQRLAFPDSVVSYFQGMMGQPAGGFPKELQAAALKGKEAVTCRPGELLPPADFEAAARHLAAMLGHEPTGRDIIGWCLYPKVLEEYIRHRQENADVSRMETSVFFLGMTPGEMTELTIEDGKTLLIKYVGKGEANDDGTRDMLFELNGVRREVTVPDDSLKVVREKVTMANPANKLEVGSSLPGAVSKLLVREGEQVKEGQALAVIEAMKMEVSIAAPVAGAVKSLAVRERDSVRAGQLLLTLS
ncbi:MAG: pyruvate carboxylase [Peptococcaceae bacterium]|jgi:pyruvate carboxylase|nr:pyruvate carboxylase [Peptococcaceae bacterium]